MLVIASNDGYIKLASESFSKVLGYTPDEVLGNSYLSFIHLQDHASVKVQLEKLGREKDQCISIAIGYASRTNQTFFVVGNTQLRLAIYMLPGMMSQK